MRHPQLAASLVTGTLSLSLGLAGCSGTSAKTQDDAKQEVTEQTTEASKADEAKQASAGKTDDASAEAAAPEATPAQAPAASEQPTVEEGTAAEPTYVDYAYEDDTASEGQNVTYEEPAYAEPEPSYDVPIAAPTDVSQSDDACMGNVVLRDEG